MSGFFGGGGGGPGSDTTAIHDNVAAEISAIAEKAVPTTSDWLIIEDVADSDNKKKVSIGNLPFGTSTLTVEAKTSDYPVVSGDQDKLFTNEGAGGLVNFTLPTAASGLRFSFYCQNANLIRVTANAGDTIRLGSSVTAPAGNILATAVGDFVTLVAINATEWVAMPAHTGTWTVT